VTSQALFVNFPIRPFHLTDAITSPFVILAAHAAIGLGTMAGGWRIVKTMGQRITKLTPFAFRRRDERRDHALYRLRIWNSGSTTHTITGAITGVGRANRISRCGGAWLSACLGVDADDPGSGGNRRAHLPAAARGRLIELQGQYPPLRSSLDCVPHALAAEA